MTGDDKKFEKRAFTIKEAAGYACVCRSTVKNWIARGILPFEELPGEGSGSHRFMRIRKEDLDEFLDRFYNQSRQIKWKKMIKIKSF